MQKNPAPAKRAFFAAILLFGLLAMTARTATDPDLWWHLRTGQLITETGQVPRTDSFSFTRAGSPWVSHEWLSEALFYQLWQHGGPGALIIFSAVITTAGFLLLYFRCPGKPHWAAAATVIGAWASAPSWGARPQMFTFTLASLLLWLIDRAEDRPRLLFAIPPMFLLWLNLHAGFALGVALLLLYAAGLTLEAIAGSTPWENARPIILRILLVAAACLALVPLNPSGTRLYRYPFTTLLSSGMRASIVEWFSPDFHQWLYLPFLLVFLLLLAALATGRPKPKGRVLLPLIFTSFAALDAVRHIPIFVLLAIPVIAAAIPASSPSLLISTAHRTPARFRTSFNVAAPALLALFAMVRWVYLAAEQPVRETRQFPQKAIEFLHASNQPERLFVYYDWGGYAIWKLNPQYRVFADGRADLYENDLHGDDLLWQCIHTVVHLHSGWRAILDDWNVQTILVPPNTAVVQALLLDPGWKTAYRDSQAVVFVHRSTRLD